MNIRIRRIKEKSLTEALFADFNRHQEVTRCFRAEGGKWVIRDIVFTEEWGENEKKELVRCLASTLAARGIIYGAFDGDRIVGFLSVENKRFGSRNQYVELSSLHVDADYRKQGIGRQLFECAASCADSLGAEKLYISAHSSVESQAFYRKMGCVEALEFNPENLKKEPCDCQLEYDLKKHTSHMAIYMVLGLVPGLVFGKFIFQNPAIGMCLGMAIGLILGANIDADNRKKRLHQDTDSTNSGGHVKASNGNPVTEGGPTGHTDNVGSHTAECYNVPSGPAKEKR